MFNHSLAPAPVIRMSSSLNLTVQALYCEHRGSGYLRHRPITTIELGFLLTSRRSIGS